jgi:outer membrane protein assembly factor BamB
LVVTPIKSLAAIVSGVFLASTACSSAKTTAAPIDASPSDDATGGNADASSEGGMRGPADAHMDSAGPTDGSLLKDAPMLEGDGVDGPGGDVMIADQFNNRVVEIDRRGNIIWHFGDGSSTPGATSVVAPNDAERLPNGDTLICGTGAPPSAGAAYGVTEAACAQNGCTDSRVLLVNSAGAITWQYGQAGVSGDGPGQLSTPVAARMLSTGNVLITDQGNSRVIEVNQKSMAIVWQYPTGQDGGSPLSDPNSAERLANGNTLIADEGNDRVIEIDASSGNIVWQYPTTPKPALLSGPAFASRLPNGNTLITDSGNSRIVEVSPSLAVVWTYVTNARGSSFPQPFPTHAMRLADGDTLISDQLNDQVIEVNPSGAIVFSYGVIQIPGNGPGQLQAPYDAKVVGDFTGLTAPQ